MSDDEQKDRFGLAFPLCAAILAAGTLGALDVPPFPGLAQGARATATFVAEKIQKRPLILGPIVYRGKGVVAYRKDMVGPGNTLIEGIFPSGNEVRLYDSGGRELHRWTADFFKVWPDAPKHLPSSRIPQSQLNYFIQGMWPLRDGSIILNFGDLGAARLDACSRTIWRSDRPTHHAVTPTSDGNFLIPGHISVFKTPNSLLPAGMTAQQIQDLLGHDFKDYNNSILLVDAQGKVLKETSVLKAIYDAGLENAIYSSLQEVVTDPTHLNDIEVVTPELAARMDNVDAGDLLISLREMNMLAVLDKEGGHVKWRQQGPWVRQHDIDITPDGHIEIFNNRSKVIGASVDSSQILSFDPESGQTKILFPVGKNDRFYTFIMGSHQKLGNGNRLIAETVAGRVFEVTPKGEVVWDFRMPYDDKAASLLTNAMRIPVDYFEKEALSCPQQS